MQTSLHVHDYFEILKLQVLYRAEIKHIAPADCYSLSLKIQDKTKKRISETTLKRIFGFAAAYHNPSTYTRNTLAEYCGYNNYESFLSSKEKEELKKPKYRSWAKILENAHKISRFRIRSNKHRSGISYNSTVERSQIEQIINEFTSSSLSACVIQAPAGGGKTIGLTRWIDKRINKKSLGDRKDIYLFIETSNLLISSPYSFHAVHWLSYLVGLENSNDLQNFLNSHKKSAPGNFYLIIDDLSNSILSEKEYCSIFTELINMVNYFSTFNWFKMILSVRPHIWQRNKHLIKTNENIHKQWCTKVYKLKGFNNQEIEQLGLNLNFGKHFHSLLKSPCLPAIKLPLYFQIYGQIYRKRTSVTPPNAFDKFNVLRFYLNNHVLNGSYSNEKSILLHKLSKYLIYKNDSLYIDQTKAISICNQFPKVYEQLINSGILHLFSDKNNNIKRVSEIRFESKTLGSYFFALRFLKTNRNVFDKKLIHRINRFHCPNSIKTKLLYWLIVLAIESSNFEFLNYLDDADFIRFKETKIILFTIDSIENILDEKTKKEFKNKISSLEFLDFALLHLSFHSDHYSTLKSLLNYNINLTQRILIHSALAIMSLNCLRDDLMLFHLKELKSINSTVFENFSLNPCRQINAVYNYFKHGTICMSALEEIKSFIDYNYRKNNQSIHPIISFTAFFFSTLHNNPEKSINFLSAIQKHRILNKVKLTDKHHDYIQLMRAHEWIKYDQGKKARTISIVPPLTLNSNPFTKMLYSIYELNFSKTKHDFHHSAQEIIKFAKNHNFLFHKTLIRLYCIENLNDETLSPLPVSEHKESLKNIFKDSGFRIENFKSILNPPISDL